MARKSRKSIINSLPNKALPFTVTELKFHIEASSLYYMEYTDDTLDKVYADAITIIKDGVAYFGQTYSIRLRADISFRLDDEAMFFHTKITQVDSDSTWFAVFTINRKKIIKTINSGKSTLGKVIPMFQAF